MPVPDPRPSATRPSSISILPSGDHTVKAAVCREFGRPLAIEDVDIADPGPGEVRVRIRACAICHSDISYAEGAWGGPLPAVYGHEAAGIVDSVGAGVKSTRAGEHVVVTLVRSCGHCHYCARELPVACETSFPLDHTSPIRSRDGQPIVHGLRTGSFAELVVVHASQLVAVPADLPFDSASLLACGVITGYGAVVNTAAVPAGSSVAVIGVGGIGLNSIQAAALAGARPVIAVDLVDGKLEAALRFGASHAVNPAHEDVVGAVRAATGGRGADFVFVAVGAKAAFEQAFTLLARAGAVVVVGMPATGVVSAFDPGSLAGWNQRILGSKMGGTRIGIDIPRLVDLYRAGRLKLDELISGRYPLDGINEAIDAVNRGNALRNVIVF
jgi:Zn-dependent alcohol dehydrogenase